MNQLLQEKGGMTLAAFPKRSRMLRFLGEWANTSLDKFPRLARRYPEFHPAPWDWPPGQTHESSIPTNWTESLREAWRETKPEARDWKLAQLLSLAAQARGTAAFQHADWARNVALTLTEAIRLAERLVVCANPECPAPFFVRKRKNQAQCSEECAAWAQRNWKRDWWARRGDNWRESRKKDRKPRQASARWGAVHAVKRKIQQSRKARRKR